MLLLGSFVAVMVTFIDVAGATRGLWQYNIRIFPILPGLFPYDYTAAPIMMMLAYQYTSSWKGYFFGVVLVSAAFAFVFQPLFQLAGVIKLFEWHHGLSFLLLIIVGLIARFALQTVTAVELSAKPERVGGVRPFRLSMQPMTKPLTETEEHEKNKGDSSEEPQK